MLSREEKMKKNKTPLFGGKKEERLSKLLPKSVQSIQGDLKKIRREMCIESPRGFESESNSRI